MKRTVTSLLFGLACSANLPAATFVVTRADDPPPGACLRFDCSLREAVMAANARSGHDEILLAARTYQLSRTSSADADPSRGPLWIRDTVEVRGHGPGATRVRWNDASYLWRGMRDPVFRVWHSESIGPVALRGLSISHGRGDSGGCVQLAQSHTTYTLHDLVIEQCHALNGGGMSINAALTELTRVVVRDCTAVYDGGGLTALRGSTLLLDSVEIHDNRAGRHGGGISLAQFDWDNPSSLALFDRGASRIFDNHADGNGGGIAVAGDVDADIVGDIGRLDISQNTAADSGGGVWRGPRYVALQPRRLFLAHADVNGNRALRGAGVAVAENATATLQNASLVKNVAQAEGGGLRLQDASTQALLQHVSVHGNAAASGGGIAGGCGSARLENVSMQYNHATQGAAIDSGGTTSLAHVTVYASTGSGMALLARDDAACALRRFDAVNSLIADSCHVAHASAFSDGGNQYGPAALGCPSLPGLDQRQASTAVFGLSVEGFGAPYPVAGWQDDGAGRPQQDFIAPDAWCLPDDVRGQPRGDGACDSGAFEAQ